MLIYPQGNVADGQPDFGKSMKIGSIARTALPAAQLDGTRIPILVDEFGRLILAGGALAGVQMVEGDVAHDLPDSNADNFPVKIGGRAYAATPAPVADGDRVSAYFDRNGRLVVLDEAVHPGDDDTNNVLGVTTKPLAISTYSPLLVTSFGAATDINVKAAPGNVFALSGENRNAATRYLQIHNLAAAIGAAAVPIYVWPVPTGTTLVLGNDFFTIPGAWFSTGIRIGWSTTEHTYTAATAADHTTHVHYI